MTDEVSNGVERPSIYREYDDGVGNDCSRLSSPEGSPYVGGGAFAPDNDLPFDADRGTVPPTWGFAQLRPAPRYPSSYFRAIRAARSAVRPQNHRARANFLSNRPPQDFSFGKSGVNRWALNDGNVLMIFSRSDQTSRVPHRISHAATIPGSPLRHEKIPIPPCPLNPCPMVCRISESSFPLALSSSAGQSPL